MGVNHPQATIAEDKADVAGSSLRLVKRIARVLGPLGGKSSIHKAAVNLGIDFQPGAMRSAWAKAGRRKGRFAAAVSRKARIMKVRRRLSARKGRMSRISMAGSRPSLAFGAKVNGVTDAEWAAARRILLAPADPVTSGTSLRAKVALVGDPAGGMAVAPILAWAQEVWRAATGAGGSHMAFPELRRVWEMSAHAFIDGWQVPGPCAWRKVPGPVAACCLSMRRIGWRAMSPFKFVTDEGH